jgi:hypothetical protein
MIQKFEDKDLNFKDKLSNRIRMKEKGIVIKVKKNQIEENVNTGVNNENIQNNHNSENSKINDNNSYRHAVEKKLNGVDCKIEKKEELASNQPQIGYMDYTMDPDNDFLEPLI